MNGALIAMRVVCRLQRFSLSPTDCRLQRLIRLSRLTRTRALQLSLSLGALNPCNAYHADTPRGLGKAELANRFIGHTTTSRCYPSFKVKSFHMETGQDFSPGSIQRESEHSNTRAWMVGLSGGLRLRFELRRIAVLFRDRITYPVPAAFALFQALQCDAMQSAPGWAKNVRRSW
jgi:hypothetical protein